MHICETFLETKSEITFNVVIICRPTLKHNENVINQLTLYHPLNCSLQPMLVGSKPQDRVATRRLESSTDNAHFEAGEALLFEIQHRIILWS